jgi:hypothetical protein
MRSIRMTEKFPDNERREEIKRRILMLASKEAFPLTVPKVSEELEITYPMAQGLLFELTIEGYFLFKKQGWTKLFVLNPEKFLPKNAVILKEGEVNA